MLSRALSPIDWSRSAKEIHDQVRGLTPWPATSTDILGDTIKVFAVEEPGIETGKAAGTILAANKAGIDVACGDGKVIRLTEIQAPRLPADVGGQLSVRTPGDSGLRPETHQNRNFGKAITPYNEDIPMI